MVFLTTRPPSRTTSVLTFNNYWHCTNISSSQTVKPAWTKSSLRCPTHRDIYFYLTKQQEESYKISATFGQRLEDSLRVRIRDNPEPAQRRRVGLRQRREDEENSDPRSKSDICFIQAVCPGDDAFSGGVPSSLSLIHI